MVSEPGLDAVAATLYTPLYARAHAAERVPKAGLSDPVAADLLARVGDAVPNVLTDQGNVAGAIWRTVIFDDLTERFCRAHPEGMVLSAGIGLCTRRQRLLGSVPDTVTWTGVDVAPVIALRRRELPDDPTTLIAASIAEPSWAAQVNAHGKTVLILAEGVLMYLDGAELAGFLGSAHQRFGSGTELVADYFHPRIALSGRHPIVKATGAQFRSGARDGRALAGLAPGWTLTAEHDVMARISTPHRIAATAFRLATLGGRPYSIAHLTHT
jgi:O-methyltransferase